MATLMMANRTVDGKKLLDKSPFTFLSTSIMGRAMDIGEGIRKYRRQLDDEPENVEALIGLANIFLNTGQTAKSQSLLERAAALD